jgi:methyltransferase (TIGR00027 family)
MPDVFAFKEQVITNRGAKPDCERRIIPADLREDWPRALIDAGFDSAQPAAWLIEGLLMYLDESERNLLMDRVGSISAAGSRIALDHRGGFFSPPPVTSEDDPSGSKAAARFAALAAAASSDLSLVTPEAWLSRHGWRAKVLDAAAVFALYGRPVPLQPQSKQAGAPRSWMATARRD